jgi:hypothetical protein
MLEILFDDFIAVERLFHENLDSISSSVTSLGSHVRYACADRVFTFARVVQSIQLQVFFMENFDSEKPTTEVSSVHSEEVDLFVEVDIDGSNENDDLPAESSSFLRQLNQSLHAMVCVTVRWICVQSLKPG